MRVENFTEGDEPVIRVEMPGIDPDEDVEHRLPGLAPLCEAAPTSAAAVVAPVEPVDAPDRVALVW